MRIMKLNDLTGHDVYEFCTGKDYPGTWNENSLFLSTEDFLLLSPYLNEVFTNYHYYGPQKVSFCKWEKVKESYLSSKNKDFELIKFFTDIDNWISKENGSYDYFWILGV